MVNDFDVDMLILQAVEERSKEGRRTALTELERDLWENHPLIMTGKESRIVARIQSVGVNVCCSAG